MNHFNYFKDLFESIFDYRKTVLLLFLIKNDDKILLEFGFLKSDIKSLPKEFQKFLIEQSEEYLSFIENEEESLIEKILIK